MKISASDIINLLNKKYPVEKFLTVPECKIGSTWFKSMCSRFDFWVMARSWAHPQFIGCEVKVNRQDFIRDTKWPSYLDYCTEFYFVSPPGIIAPEEVPEQAGLMVCTKNCKKIITKKKAPVRDVQIPHSIFIYILMCRTRITEDTGRPMADLWKDRLKEMQSNKRLGHEVAFTIRHQVEKKVRAVLDENRKLHEENEKLQVVKDCMENLGISTDDFRFGGRYTVERKLKEALSGIPFDLPQYLKQIERNAGLALKSLGGNGDAHTN